MAQRLGQKKSSEWGKMGAELRLGRGERAGRRRSSPGLGPREARKCFRSALKTGQRSSEAEAVVKAQNPRHVALHEVPGTVVRFEPAHSRDVIFVLDILIT